MALAMIDETASWTQVERRDGRKYGPPKNAARAAALAAGKPTYHGAPCKKGHGTLRYTKSRDCVGCRRRPVDQMSVDQLMARIDEVAPEIDWNPEKIDGAGQPVAKMVPTLPQGSPDEGGPSCASAG
jgi:hypothetical protein